MGTNKKKTASSKRKQQPEDETVVGPALPTKKDEAVQYTRPQIIATVFLALGASRFMEWQRALGEMNPLGSNNTTTPTACQAYMLTNDQVDYDSVCDSPVTYTMMSLKYDLSTQMILAVLFLVIQCWSDEILMSRLNAVLTMTPVSTTLLLLQACNTWINPRRSKMMTIASGILMFLAFPATGAVLREFRESRQKNYKSNNLVIAFGLVGMAALQLYEMWQWYVTSTQASSPILEPSTLVEWNEAWKVFLYTLMMDKFTMAALLMCVWVCFDEARQRTFLLVWAVLKFYEYQVSLQAYDDTQLVNVEVLKNMALACSVVSGVGWIAPTMGGKKADGPKSKAM